MAHAVDDDGPAGSIATLDPSPAFHTGAEIEGRVVT